MLERGDDTPGTPLTKEITTTTDGVETTKKQGKVEPDAGTDTRNEIERTWWNITKTEIIAGVPNIKFTDIKEVDKDPRNTVEFIGTKTKEDMTTKERRTQRGGCNHERL